ncbi:putative DNA helicase [Aquamicrobium phage P14]|uniref:Putative DNA helicase n=1 Tax=Aquamicrobium phage P14 TaxID=1927013 RepID=A0A1L5C054_9CAUD|nr:putative DNA helicase [Aquamicrobium phage P14]APL99479.1 putative DNA helicase [Aquamicrobium phage P14]
MSFELTLLRMTKHRKLHSKYAKVAKAEYLDQLTATILNDQGRYLKEHPDVETIKSDAFFQWFRDFAHPNLPDEKRQAFKALIDNLSPDVEQSIQDGFMNRLVAAEHAHKLLGLISRYEDGEDLDLLTEVQDVVSSFEQETNRQGTLPEVTEDVEDLLEQDEHDIGFHWRLTELNLSIRPLRGGDFVVVAARPDTGKTSFGTSELTYMARQVREVYHEEPDRPIVWFNNEGPGSKIKKRAVSSALNMTTEELVKLKNQPATDGVSRSLMIQKFNEETDGGFKRLRIMDIHDFWSHEVEAIIKAINPAIIVFDMIDNIKFGGAGNNNGTRTDQLLEAMYQWARVLGVKYNAVVLAFSQVSGDGDGMAYPTLSMLKDSKTGKQGAADAIVTIGASHDIGLENIRYIGCTKNKLVRDGGRKDPRAEVHFHQQRGRYASPGA